MADTLALTRRDRFAMAALGYVAWRNDKNAMADEAYEMADAMEAARLRALVPPTASEAGRCEHCGSGPTCVVCRRGYTDLAPVSQDDPFAKTVLPCSTTSHCP